MNKIATLLCLFLLIPVSLHSTTVLKLSDRELTHRAKTIFTGKCIQSKSFWTKDKRRIYTVYSFLVEKKIKGKSISQVLTLKQWGGSVDGYRYFIPGIATFRLNEQVFNFLTPKNKQEFQFTVGLAQGKFTILRNRYGKKFLLRNTLGLRFQRGVKGRVEIIKDYDRFERKIRQYVLEEQERRRK
ncbi:MAG: hypothetical protein D6805_03190 [Planctomycetota bacterium]|nr:MAG: hypothetical protein D6805_03190 [Planctomycetota bacterium]